MLVQVNTEYLLEQKNVEHQPIPYLHTDWLTSKEKYCRQEHHINEKVLRMIQSDKMQLSVKSNR